MNNRDLLVSKLMVTLALTAFGSCCRAHDGFDSVRCDGDIPGALIGKAVGNERVVATEKRHKDIGLNDEGSEDISDSLSYIGWTICGGSYHLIERKGTITDALRADHSRARPAFLGKCEIDGQATIYVSFAILDPKTPIDANQHVAPDDSTLVPASAAWRIDEKDAKFVKINVAGLMCPRSGIFSVDGGP